MSHERRRSSWAGPLVAALILVAGCGSSPGPAEEVPALATVLTRIDDAVVAGRHDAARRHLNDLVSTATQARDKGRLDPAEADRILTAAAGLASALPDRDQTAEPARSESPPATPTPDDRLDEEPDVGEGDQTEKEREELAKKREEEQKKRKEELKKEAEERKKDGGGNGDSSDNGPDDGEGN